MNKRQKAEYNILNKIIEYEYTYTLKEIYDAYLKYLKGSYTSYTANILISECKEDFKSIFKGER